MDKNQATGLILISILMIAYFWFFADAPQQPENIESNQVEQNDQQEKEIKTSDNINQSAAAIESDSSLNQALINQFGVFANVAKGESQISSFNTETLNIQFNSKGGRIRKVELKEFETHDGQPLIITNQEDEEKELLFNTSTGAINLYDLHFEMEGSPKRELSNGDTIEVKFVAQIAPNKSIEQIYTLSGNQYQVGYSLAFNGFTNEILGDQLTLQ